ncbi:hypothetical protein EYC87_16010 [Halieaceae bacterium IMCC8485]|uniref:Sulfotransferase domain-containing protein n=1 Tax=Candidatus Seongchinamella marina TaxID=2518990 RepID=A0ABT3SYP2_9GAMM|nr:hypothetical protein [Candidatus Seongchinamella marina]MCX2975093.1 hypothetical protein [Candidatus Seongchinamella marina]
MESSKAVFLHVGNFKTGTSAVQKYCSENRQLLIDKGLDYLEVARPTTNKTNHGQLALSLYRETGKRTPDWYVDEVSYRAISAEVLTSIKASPCQKILISSEEFYRIPAFDDASRTVIRKSLRALFRGHTVKVIVYVRNPMDFIKSWYNEVNKSRFPIRRFVDYVFHLDKRMVLPDANVNFWRHVFGNDAVIIEPYALTGIEHIKRFLTLASVSGLEFGQSTALNINLRLDNSSLERDRINKIMAVLKGDERERYLRSTVLSSVDKLNSLERKLAKISADFKRFCDIENLKVSGAELSLYNVLVHDEAVNRRDLISPSLFGIARAKISNSSVVLWAKKCMHKIKFNVKSK